MIETEITVAVRREGKQFKYQCHELHLYRNDRPMEKLTIEEARELHQALGTELENYDAWVKAQKDGAA